MPKRLFHLLPAGILLFTPLACAANTEPSRPPSILLILTDDQGYGDLGCYGADDLATPNIDQLAREGALLTSAYASPVCTPTRASLLTGAHPLRVDMDRVLYTQRDRKGLNPAEVTIAELLRDAGYHTAALGKWHLGGLPPVQPPAHGFTEWFGFPSGHNHGRVGIYHRLLHRDRKPPPRFEPLMLMEDGELVEAEPAVDTLTERFNDRAIEIIRRTPADQPFFIYLAHPMPHYPVIPGRDFVGSSARGTAYGDTVEELDFRVGQLLDALEETGRADDTIVIFMSDNGPTGGYGEENGDPGPLRGRKASVWEGGVRVPCIVRWPGRIPAGQVLDEPVTMMDWYPTFATIAGVTPPNVARDGQSLLPLLTGNGAWTPPEAILHTRRGQPGAIRMGDWKYLETRTKGSTTGEVTTRGWLFNLSRDPGERFDLSRQEPERVDAMRQRLHALHAEILKAQRPALKVPKE